MFRKEGACLRPSENFHLLLLRLQEVRTQLHMNKRNSETGHFCVIFQMMETLLPLPHFLCQGDVRFLQETTKRKRPSHFQFLPESRMVSSMFMWIEDIRVEVIRCLFLAQYLNFRKQSEFCTHVSKMLWSFICLCLSQPYALPSIGKPVAKEATPTNPTQANTANPP